MISGKDYFPGTAFRAVERNGIIGGIPDMKEMITTFATLYHDDLALAVHGTLSFPVSPVRTAH